MLCQNCGKNEATTHIRRVVNGDTTQMHLCADCAQHLGYGDMFSGFGLNLDDFFGGFLGDTVQKLASPVETRCQKCGNTFGDIVRSGKVGCSECYKTFYDKLLPSIQRIHGRIKHNGKQVSAVESTVIHAKEIQENPIEQLKKELADAIEKQEFEQAAVIRDKIKELESE
ncbi:MAG: UvrB/UvrC motif-containing protein [Clostridia bacterium]|nr:UvrB/UvrC motif-containing protein [Clostridia bacterium]